MIVEGLQTENKKRQQERSKIIRMIERQYERTAVTPYAINMIDAHDRLVARKLELEDQITNISRKINYETFHADTTITTLRTNRENMMAQLARVNDALIAIVQTITESEKRVCGLLEMVEPELSIYPFAKIGVSA